MKYIFITLYFLFPFLLGAQVTGTITNQQGKKLPAVSVLLKNSYLGTSTNSNGEYALDKIPHGQQTLVFKSLGYKTTEKIVVVTPERMHLNIVLEDDANILEEVVVKNTGNPALRIIKEAIRNRKINGEKVDRFQADFYSKGMMRINGMPKKMAKEASKDTPGLDSTGSGIIYLSETVSKIKFQKPNKLYEEVIASKLSGDDKGFSFNTAIGANFDFYSNTVGLGNGVISPIASNALAYYDYKLVGTHEEDGHHIFKISVTPKRDKEPVVNGIIYIVDDSWEIYAVDFSVPGYRTQQPILDTLALIQHYAWHAADKRWTKSLQRIDFKLSFFGIKASGNYLQNFSNYELVREFPKGTFSNTITKINGNANRMDSLYWKRARPIALTLEERNDYTFKDSIQAVRTSKPYVDSIDRQANKFNILDPLMGYTYQNSYRHYKIEYKGLSNLTKASFNAVQGFTLTAALNASLGTSDTGRYTKLNTDFQYGFSEKKLRFYATVEHRFNTKNYATLALQIGNNVVPFNEGYNILPLLNNITSLFFKDSYLQLYQREQLRLQFAQNISTPLRLFLSTGWARRSPLFNHSNYSFLKKDEKYVSNHPLLPNDYETPAFTKNNILEMEAGLRWAPGQKSIDRPDATLLLRDTRYPVFSIGYKRVFNLTDKDWSYQQIQATINQTKNFGNFGSFSGRINLGKLFHADDIPFMDYKHFEGNQTHIGTKAVYDNNFLLLPYYSYSSNDQYLQLHAEHNFKGYFFNKIPLIQELQWGFVMGYHLLSTSNRKPYHEFSAGIDNIGWGKYRLLRVDYVRSLQNGRQTQGFVVGLKFLNLLN